MKVKLRDERDGEVLGTIREKSRADAVELPSVLTNRFGAGRVVDLSAGFDAAYYLYPYPYQRLVLKHAIEWAAQSPSPVRVKAPHCVHSTVMRQTVDGHDRLVINLFDDLNTTAFHALPNDDVPLREETVPIHDIAITLDPRYLVRSATYQTEGIACRTETTPVGTRVHVSRLDVHGIVVVDLQ